RLSEAVREALGKSGEISRGLGPKDQAETRNDAQQRLLDAEALKSKIEIKSETKSEAAKADALTETKTKQQQQELDEITKKKQLDENLAETKRLQDQALALQLKEQQEREEKQRQLDEQNERDRKERELQEKQKQDEKKKQEDNERIHIVAKGDSLNSLAKRYFNNKSYAEIIYDRNMASINVVTHKGRKYSDLQVKQKLMIPNQKFVDNFKQSMLSHKGIDFGGVNYGSVEEELKSKYGINWDGTSLFAGAKTAAGVKDGPPIQRRTFSGKGNVLSHEKKENIESMLGPIAAESSKSRKQTVHLGQTIKSIANKLYGSPAYWRLLALKNNLSTEVDKRKDPVVQLHRGQMLRLPDQDEIASFQRDPDNPVVVSLYTDDNGLFQPLTRRCGSCERDTLSMAVVCVSCGFDMDCPVEDDFEPEDEEVTETVSEQTSSQEPVEALVHAGEEEAAEVDDEEESEADDESEELADNEDLEENLHQANHSDNLEDPLDQIAAVELQSVTFVDRKNPKSFTSPTAQNHQTHEFAPPIEQTPPEDNLFKLEFENEGRDPLWTPEPTPEVMDPAVQIIEYGISHGDVQGLCISLQIV
ncbi:MAG: LysM peptidoglycan-binding domain-containing protein, partial [Candidatus Obscuribacterales bacterium]|nr:LysM peptidoglycan-binding domain-containing protein [Candidatus Obscuribacterales bacterium]